jgi:hypothetical protein
VLRPPHQPQQRASGAQRQTGHTSEAHSTTGVSATGMLPRAQVLRQGSRPVGVSWSKQPRMQPHSGSARQLETASQHSNARHSPHSGSPGTNPQPAVSEPGPDVGWPSDPWDPVPGGGGSSVVEPELSLEPSLEEEDEDELSATGSVVMSASEIEAPEGDRPLPSRPPVASAPAVPPCESASSRETRGPHAVSNAATTHPLQTYRVMQCQRSLSAGLTGCVASRASSHPWYEPAGLASVVSIRIAMSCQQVWLLDDPHLDLQ